jgi:hypothetical protein
MKRNMAEAIVLVGRSTTTTISSMLRFRRWNAMKADNKLEFNKSKYPLIIMNLYYTSVTNFNYQTIQSILTRCFAGSLLLKCIG